MIALVALALAQEPVAAPDLPEAWAITVSGGVTLGNHESGYLYVLTEALKRSGAAAVPITTGASAGSANGLMSALDLCDGPLDDPRETMGWNLWVTQGFEVGVVPERATATSLFSPQALRDRLGPLDAVWARGLPTRCDVVVAIPVTRLEAMPVRLNESLALPRQTFRFVLRIRGRGPGVAPELSNLVDTGAAVPQLLLPLTGDPASDLDLVRDVVLASAAFPLAFPAVPLSYCVADVDAPDPTACPVATEQALFIDGGVFDNIPLRTAHRLTGALLRVGEEGPAWSVDPADPRAPWPAVRHVYIDPVIRGYPERPDGLGAQGELGLGEYLAAFAGGFVMQARSAELYALAEERPDVMAATFVTWNRYPQASRYVENFVGAFDTSFRRYDFALGMVDAWLDLGRMEGEAPARGRAALEPLLTTEAWAPAACLLSVMEPSRAALRPACEGEDLRNVRILAQIGLDQVYSICRGQDPAAVDPWGHAHCTLAARGALPPELVEGDFAAPIDRLRREGEGEFAHFLRLLAAYDYALDDLGLDPRRARHAPSAMADALVPAVDAMARRQPDLPTQRLLRAVGRQGLGLAFAPPSDPAHAYLLTGTLGEVGGTVRLSDDATWLRWNVGLQADGFLSLLVPDRERFNVALATGPELDLLARKPGPFRPLLALRVAMQAGVLDQLGSIACDPQRDTRDCTQPELQGLAAVEIAELVRVQGELDVLPFLPGDAIPLDVHLALGIRF